MSDRRSTLPPEIDPAAGLLAQITVPVVDLSRKPDGTRDRQLQFGAAVMRFPDQQGWSLVQAIRDGYVGYVPTRCLGPKTAATHWVSALACHVYRDADIKSPDLCTLGFGSQVTVTQQSGAFAACAGGFVPQVHLTAIESVMDDPVSVAELFLGTPYLWGGNSRLGIDCSGLVQASMWACGIKCPGDSDQQQAGFGLLVNTPPRRGDLLFWTGHVALVVDEDRIIHANAGSMSVRYEGINAAIARIATQGDGDVTAHKRLRR